MRICGIVSEYNPFHSGHAWHIAQAKKITDADLVVCVMSASFVQRGEPAVFDKWTRAACALLAGADAVVELPLLSAVQSAEGFARGGVAVLHALGSKAISFGSETGDTDLLVHAARSLTNETAGFKRALRQSLDEGVSFPTARVRAAVAAGNGAWDEAVVDVLSQPNAILGIEYIKAILQSGADITPYAVQRTGGAYHSTDIEESIPSATALRTALKTGQMEKALSAMPQAVRAYVCAQLDAGLAPAFPGNFDDALLFTLRRGGRDYLRHLHEVSEGLENRIFDAAQRYATRESIIAEVKTKRYTFTRISRILLYALLGITRENIREYNRAPLSHIRVLGVKEPGVLSTLSKTCSVPLITGSIANSSYPKLDAAATDVWALTQHASPFCDGYQDYTQKLLISSQF